MFGQLDRQFSQDGFVVVRGLLSKNECAYYVSRLKELAGPKDRWMLRDGVNRHRDFWPVIFNARLIDSVRAILGPAARYLPHNDMHAGFSSFSWHRASVNRRAGVGPDWDETKEPYRIARVGIYLQDFAGSQFKLGLIKGSHRLGDANQRRMRRRTSAVANVVSGLSGVDFVGSSAEWVATEPGDAVIFDPRVLHTASRCRGERYSIFLAYGIANSHFQNHWQYYQNLGKDSLDSAIAPELAGRLLKAGLLAEEAPVEGAIVGAWISSVVFTRVARRFR